MLKTRLFIAFVAASSFGCPVWGQDAVPAKPTTSKATPEQAKAFIESMVEQYARSDSHGHRQQLISVGSRVILQSKSVTDSGNLGDTNTISFLMQDVSFSYDQVDKGDVKARVLINCKTGKCMSEKNVAYTVYQNENDGKPKENPKLTYTRSIDAAALFVSDEQIAQRLSKALIFYQEHSPEAAPSPF